MINLDLIKQASERIAGHAIRTPMATSAALSERIGTEVYLKLEHYQLTGSFKLRGATNAVLLLSQLERERGVIAASTGNHGRALSYAARAVGSRATIC
ncbi:MAG: pyridoxal-phosphate dependent enzyme, partial [Mesorhizobium sp.]